MGGSMFCVMRDVMLDAMMVGTERGLPGSAAGEVERDVVGRVKGVQWIS